MNHALIDRSVFRRILTRSAILPILLPILLALVLIGRVNRLLATFKWLEHSNQVISHAQDLSRSIAEMHFDESRYLFSGRADYLASYNRARKDASLAVEGLAQSVSDNRGQTTRIRTISETLKLWEAGADEEIKRRQAAKAYSPVLEAEHEGEQADTLRTQMTAFTRAEEQLRSDRYRKVESDTRGAVGGVFVLMLGIGLVQLLVMLRQAHAMSRAYEQSGEMLLASERHLSTTLRSIADGVIAADTNGKITFLNPVAERMTGWTQAEAEKADVNQVFKLVSEEKGEAVESPFVRVLREGKVTELPAHTLLVARDGVTHPIDDAGAPIRDDRGEIRGVVLVFHDVSARRRLEMQLFHAQKMEGIGRLAGGVAHDFNNMLTAILGFAEMIELDTDPGDPRAEYVGNIKRAAERAADLTRQLLAFSRQQIIAPKVVDPNVAVMEAGKMLRRLLGEDIEFVTIPQEGAGSIRVDPGQFEQIIVNLAVNARDAMPNGGKLIIETANVTLDENYAKTHHDVVPGEYVMLAVTDTGVGLDLGTQARVFEPFFTTKEKGRGTGLGLSTVYGIVKQSGGHIWLYSEVGHGATFKIYMPRVFTTQDTQRTAPSAATPPNGSETILVVEDEMLVRALTVQALTSFGYKVLEAGGGEEAIQVSTEYPDEIHLLLTDVVMPLMSGRKLAEHLHGKRPNMRVLYASGYTDNSVVHHGVLDEGVWFLQKPFTTQSLAARVREVLDAE